MWSSFCGSMGIAGWVLMVGLWATLIGAVVWAVTRLFPSPPHRPDTGRLQPPAPPRHSHGCEQSVPAAPDPSRR